MSFVRIKSESIIERRINGKNGPQIIREQRACILLGDGYETTFNVGLGDGLCYSVGDYLIHPDSYGQNNYGEPALKRVKLWPLSVAVKSTGVALAPPVPAASGRAAAAA
ncbi:single-stranded DNA-binding protein [Xanthomonas sp. XNM01]|uniref:single-stranded DNA-binding protein n=1 Tax=Xanthomonas sp. XNM01 TaxID=2769289 RepID=UPI00177E58D8|nr:single-stranded DNA-binding protein [Xanthomonas sp. XNM01]MBD9368369.1 hypothetical protein [Xanthomonas sp. XNM01]